MRWSLALMMPYLAVRSYYIIAAGEVYKAPQGHISVFAVRWGNSEGNWLSDYGLAPFNKKRVVYFQGDLVSH